MKHEATIDLPKSKPMSFPIGFGRCFELNLTVTVIYLLVLAALLALGSWQIDRRAYKLSYNQKVNDFISKQTLPLNYQEALTAFEKVGRQASDIPVQITGNFRPELVIFHDNRVQNGQAGLHAFGLFDPEVSIDPVKQLPPILINLGWTPWPSLARGQLPDIQLPETQLSLKGKLFAPNPKTLSLEQTPPPPQQGKWLVQKLNLSQAELLLGESLAPFTLKLNPDSLPFVERIVESIYASKGGQYFIRDFPATTQWPMPPEKHLGYAFQWFLMAIVLTGIYIKLHIKKIKKSPIKI